MLSIVKLQTTNVCFNFVVEDFLGSFLIEKTNQDLTYIEFFVFFNGYPVGIIAQNALK